VSKYRASGDCGKFSEPPHPYPFEISCRHKFRAIDRKEFFRSLVEPLKISGIGQQLDQMVDADRDEPKAKDCLIVGDSDRFDRGADQLVDRFTLAIDAIDRVPALKVRGSHAREALMNQQIDCRHYAYEEGIDLTEIVSWKWPL
jgi:hypothetical protein